MSAQPTHSPADVAALGALAITNRLLERILGELSKADGWQGNAAQASVKNGARTEVQEAAAVAAGEVQELARENPWRQEIIIYNNLGSSTLNLYFGDGVNVAQYVIQIPAGATFVDDIYTGPIWGAWATTTGSAQVTTV